MSKMSGRGSLTAILSIADDSAPQLSFGAASARRRRRNVTEDQIVRALAPAKKPLTRGLSVGPAGRSGGGRRGGTFRSDHPRPDDALALDHRARGNRHHRQGQAEYRSGNQLRLQFGRHQRQIAALGAGAGQGADQSRPEGLDLRRRRPYRRRRRRGLQSGSVGAARRLDQALSGRQIRHRRPADLVTVGYGKSKLKDPAKPMAEANRRVQVVNMANKATASQVNGVTASEPVVALREGFAARMRPAPLRDASSSLRDDWRRALDEERHWRAVVIRGSGSA